MIELVTGHYKRIELTPEQIAEMREAFGMTRDDPELHCFVQSKSKEYLTMPFYGPEGVNLTAITPKVAIIPEDQGEPISTDWGERRVDKRPGRLPARRLDQETPGSYLVFVSLTSGQETPSTCQEG